MQAIQFDRYGGPEVLRVVDLPLPEPGPGQVRVRLHAAGVAQVDAKLRAGVLQQHFALSLPKVPGRDGVGTVDAVGEGVTRLAVGDAVCVMAAPTQAGTCAQHVVLDAQRVVPRPARLSTHQAAALLQPGLSAWTAVATAGVSPGMRVLVHAGSGAVGSLVVQHARHLGADVTATCRHDNREHTLAQGAQRVLAYDREDLSAVKAMDLVFDFVGGDTHARSYALLRPGGQIVYLVAAPFVDQGAAHGVRVTRAMVTDAPEAMAAVAQAAAQGVYTPLVARVLPLAEAAKAHALLDAGQVTRGRVVLDID